MDRNKKKARKSPKKRPNLRREEAQGLKEASFRGQKDPSPKPMGSKPMDTRTIEMFPEYARRRPVSPACKYDPWHPRHRWTLEKSTNNTARGTAKWTEVCTACGARRSVDVQLHFSPQELEWRMHHARRLNVDDE